MASGALSPLDYAHYDRPEMLGEYDPLDLSDVLNATDLRAIVSGDNMMFSERPSSFPSPLNVFPLSMFRKSEILNTRDVEWPTTELKISTDERKKEIVKKAVTNVEKMLGVKIAIEVIDDFQDAANLTFSDEVKLGLMSKLRSSYDNGIPIDDRTSILDLEAILISTIKTRRESFRDDLGSAKEWNLIKQMRLGTERSCNGIDIIDSFEATTRER